jgi:prevent-host-death family protein
MQQWQVQEAKQRFSELLRLAHADGPQVVTRHGEEIAVVLDMQEYRTLRGQRMDFKEFLLTDPLEIEELDIQRSDATDRVVEL